MRAAVAFAFLVGSASGFSATVVQECHAVSSAVSDQWCDTNCNHDPPNCPPALCRCGIGPAPGPAPSPAPGPAPAPPPVVGAYHDMSKATGLQGLQTLVANALTLPITRLFLAFVSPTLVYLPGSKTLAGAGMGIATTAVDAGFKDLSEAIAKLEAGGVEVFLSMGGWNYNCFPALYMGNSVAGYGSHTPNYWKVEKFGGPSNCTADNQYCFVCEPRSEQTSLDLSFAVYPEPAKAPTWQAATAYVEKGAAGSPAPVWHPEILPGKVYADKVSGLTSVVPGSGKFDELGRDPYRDVVHLAKELGCSGVDLDYEEFWHADTFKTVAQGGAAGTGPWELHQTSFKLAAILKDLSDGIDEIAPEMQLSVAAAAVGAWGGKWWGGNLKGTLLEVHAQFPSLLAKPIAANGINVMAYDLSDDQAFHECPTDQACTLDQQVAFYMGTYASAGIPAIVGYELGTPAYPDPTHDRSHQLPLTVEALALIASSVQHKVSGGFLWEVYKPTADGEATATATAQAICNAVMRGNARCSGKFPDLAPRGARPAAARTDRLVESVVESRSAA